MFFKITSEVVGRLWIDPNPPTGWYLLYPPDSNQARLVYHDLTVPNAYTGYSTTPSVGCHDVSKELVGKATPYFACVEDAVNSFEKEEKESGAGFNLISLSGRLNPKIKNLYDQREMYAFMKICGFFKDSKDLEDTIFGKVSFRYVPTSKIVPDAVFGAPFEALFKDLGGWDADPAVDRDTLSNSFNPVVINYPDGSYGYSVTMLAGSKIAYGVFDVPLLGQVYDLPAGYSTKIVGEKIQIRRETATAAATFDLKIKSSNTVQLVQLT